MLPKQRNGLAIIRQLIRALVLTAVPSTPSNVGSLCGFILFFRAWMHIMYETCH